jgi:hypothetical protein
MSVELPLASTLHLTERYIRCPTYDPRPLDLFAVGFAQFKIESDPSVSRQS